MEQLLKIDNLSVIREEKKILNAVSLTFFRGVNVFICGTSGSGKSMLLKEIKNNQKNKSIKCKGKIAVVLDNLNFDKENISEEIKFLTFDERQKELFFRFFTENDLFDNPNHLSFYKQKILQIFTCIHENPDLLFIDQIYSYLHLEDIKIFDKYFKEKHITVVITSTNIELSLNYSYMIVLNEGSVAIEGKTLQVLQEEKLLKRLGIGLPFYVDLSIQLKLYNLIDKVYLDQRKLANQLWN